MGPDTAATDEWVQALFSMYEFTGDGRLGDRISSLENALRGVVVEGVDELQNRYNVSASAMKGALTVKEMAGQVNVTIHAMGIVISLPYILEPSETVVDASLGAGNTGRAFDLETDRRIAEFKFIRWRGGAESIRQNGVFVDFFHLAEAETDKRRILYLTGLEHPTRFFNGARNLNSVLSKNAAVHNQFRAIYGDRFTVVRQYWNHVANRVELVDLLEAVPPLREAW